MKRAALDGWIQKTEGLAVLDRETLSALQLKKLNALLARERERGGFYAGLPARLARLEELSGLPFTTPEELARSPGAFLLCSQGEAGRVVTGATSGTTGLQKRLFYTQGDLENTIGFFAAGISELAGAGDHTRLAFGQPDESWGMKYNLVWDDLLELRLFPEEMKRLEAAFYAKKAEAYGVPLESGTHLARTEWTLWAAMLAGDAETAARLTEPIYRYMDEAESRVPMPDTYDAGSAKWAKQANRPAVGGCFIRLAGEKLKKER